MKRILLTGASAGIGRAIAEALTARGHEVWGSARDVQVLPVLERFHPLALDLEDEASIRAGAEQALAEAGRIDVLINNAGGGLLGALEAAEQARLEQQFQTLVFGPMALIRHLLPAMRAQDSGLIINVTSLAAEFPIPFMGVYSAAKAALSSLTWNLHMELLDSPVRVVEIRPGDIRTQFNHRLARLPDDDTAPYRHNLERAFAVYDANMRRAPPPERVAEAVRRVVEAGGAAPHRIDVGRPFQARIAPMLAGLVPHAWVRMAVRRYYRLKP